MHVQHEPVCLFVSKFALQTGKYVTDEFSLGLNSNEIKLNLV